jgi:HAD superfamily hydrolase (TIGR01662 family)
MMSNMHARLARSMHGFRLMAFDVDNTLRVTNNGAPCPNRPDQWEIKPLVREVFDRMFGAGLLWSVSMGMATNQGGVAHGFLTQRMAKGMLVDLALDLKPITGVDWHILMCPHHPTGSVGRYTMQCACRKPQPGMLFRLMMDTVSGPQDTLFVGDMESDKETARAAGCHFMWADHFFAPDQDRFRADLVQTWDGSDWIAYPDWLASLARRGTGHE